jgi:curved DNA-binding protein CbpA
VSTPVDHYAVLGVTPDADHATIRRAWIRAARASHPDGQGAADPAARARADRRIRQVNEAWRVLGDEKLRRDHDRARRAAMPKPARPAPPRPTMPDFEVEREPSGFEVPNAGVATLLRTLPWLVVGIIGVGIFVLTAFAAPDDGSTGETAVSIPECVRVRDDGSTQSVPCSWEGAAVIDELLSLSGEGACRHADAVVHEGATLSYRLCLVPYESYEP